MFDAFLHYQHPDPFGFFNHLKIDHDDVLFPLWQAVFSCVGLPSFLVFLSDVPALSHSHTSLCSVSRDCTIEDQQLSISY